MIFRDYYRILELDSSRVSMNQIKTAYRELAKKYHPDVNVGNIRAEERFKDINEAYRVLSDSSSKKKYDRMWNARVGNKKKNKNAVNEEENEDSIFTEFFNLLFGSQKVNKEETETKHKKVPIKGENIETEINITIEEAFYGIEKRISLRTVEGNLKTFSVKVPAGIRNKEKIRLIGQGKAGQNGGNNGDLFIKVNILDTKKFKLHGCDILVDLPISPWEAALGARVSATGLDEDISIFIPPGMNSSEKIKIAGKGYKDGKGGRGDLVVNVKITVPKQLSKEEKELFEKLQEISTYKPRNKENLDANKQTKFT